jgi:hypothetical protein
MIGQSAVMSTRCPSRVGTWLLVLFGLPFLAVGLFACYRTVALVYAWAEARRWVPTEARVESVELQSRGQTYGVRCTYTYTFGNSTYTGHRVGLDRGADNIGSWQQDKYTLLKREFDAERSVSCLVDPRDPQRAVLFAELRPGTLVLWYGFAVVFTLAGGGVAAGSLAARRAGLWRRQAREQYPDQPWMWTPRWADGVVRTGGWAGVIGIWAAGVFWNGVAWPVAVLVLLDLAAGKGTHWALLVLILPALGLGLLAAAVYATLGQLEFGRSELRLASMPARIGGHLQGTVIVRGAVERVTEVRLEVCCVRTITEGQGKNKRVTTTTIWQAEQLATGQPATFDMDCLSVPVDFAIPGECQPWNDADAADTIEWKLKASADIPGVDLGLEFPVPVFAA